MPTMRDKRLFHLAELLAAELNKSKGDVQPEDIVSFMQCNVPVSEDESSEEYEDMVQEHSQKPAGRGSAAISRLRKSLGFDDGDSLIAVIEKAAEFCEADRASRLPKTADGVPFFVGDTVYMRNDDTGYFGPEPILELKVESIGSEPHFKEYRGAFNVTAGDAEGGNLEFYSSRDACPKH